MIGDPGFIIFAGVLHFRVDDCCVITHCCFSFRSSNELNWHPFDVGPREQSDEDSGCSDGVRSQLDVPNQGVERPILAFFVC